MAELTPCKEEWVTLFCDGDVIKTTKNEEFDVQNDTNTSSITFDIDSDLINANTNFGKETNSSLNAKFVDISRELDLDVSHLSQDHHVINVSHEEIVPTTQTIAESSPDIQLIDQDDSQQIMTEQELASEYKMNSVNSMNATKQNNENLIMDTMDMPINEMYSSDTYSTTDVDQIVKEKSNEINTNDLMIGVNLDEHHTHNLNHTQPYVNDQQNGGTLSDNVKNRLHHVKYINIDDKRVKIWACNVLFRSTATLSEHRAIHLAVRPHVCELCQKTFNRVSTLILHRKTHSGLKKHQCHCCEKRFHRKGNLTHHIFTHTNERPYKCDVCQKGFNQMSNLKCHKFKAHQRTDKPKYMCRLCNEEFSQRMELRYHEVIKHVIKNQQQATATSIKASTSATSLSGLPTPIKNFSRNNDLLLQQSVLGGIKTTGRNTLLKNDNGGTPPGRLGTNGVLNEAGDSIANDLLEQDM